MKVLLDTNVLLDVALARPQFVVASARAVSKARSAPHLAAICAASVTTLHYLLRQTMPDARARQTIADFLAAMELASVNHAVVHAALGSAMRDFEDAVLAHAAAQAGVDAIVTRNTKDFVKSPVRAITPEQWLATP